jgi:hypothetical protein
VRAAKASSRATKGRIDRVMAVGRCIRSSSKNMPEAPSPQGGDRAIWKGRNITECDSAFGKGFFARARDFTHKKEGLLRVECQMVYKCLKISRVILSPKRFFRRVRFFGIRNSSEGGW